MRELAPDVHQIALTPRDGVNAYLLGDVLVDAGYGLHGKAVVRRVQGRSVSAHALTHAHVDHAGGSKAVLDALGVPMWVGTHDVADAERGQPVMPENGPLKGLLRRYASFTPVRVDRGLEEGDEVAGFTVLHVPGHSTGHVAYWRESDRVLVAGDVLFNMHMLTTAPGLHQPPDLFTPDPPRNRASIRRLADLEPELVLFGHGPPLRGAAPKLRAFADALPRD